MNPDIPQYSEKNQSYLIAGANPVYYLDEKTQEEQVAPLSASIDWLQMSPSLLDSYSEANQDTQTSMYNGSVISYGQSFLNVNAIPLSAVKFYLKKFGTPTGNITATIYAHTGTFGVNGKPTGSALATSEPVSIAGLTTSFALTQFNFSSTITLSANTPYVIVVNYGGGDGSNSLVIGYDISTPSGAGNASYSFNDVAWTAQNADLCFYVYGGGTQFTILEGNITHMIPSTDGTYSVYAITDKNHVYGITTTAITDLGYPSGGAGSSTDCYLAIGGGGTTYSGYLFATWAISGNIYKSPLPATSATWTTCGGTALQTSCGSHIMESFLDFIAVKDGNISYLQGGQIRKLDVSALTVGAPALIDLGTGWAIMSMRNYNNKYLAIAGGKATSGGSVNGYTSNYLFLWDGISSRYNYSIKIPGQFIDMKVIDSVLYVAVKVASGKTCLYFLYNTTLRKVTTPQISTIFAGAGLGESIISPLFDFKNYVGIHLDSNSDLTHPLMVYGKDEMGEIEFVHSSGRFFNQICVGYDGNLFGGEYVDSSTTKMYYLPTALPTNGIYQQLLYKSQWIPIKNLQAIDIYYETPPSAGTDAINITIYGQGEDILNGNSTTVLTAITPTNYLTKKRHRLDLQGFTGSQVMIKLSTINSTWRPIIRAIVPIVK